MSKKFDKKTYGKQYRADHQDEAKEYQKQYRKAHQQESQQYQQIYRKKTKEIAKQYKKEWFQKNKSKINEAAKERRKVDLQFKLAHYLRSRLRKALQQNYKSGSAVRDLGCTIPELKQYLEVRFKPGMTWDNYGEWHIDHIIPLASFNLQNPKQLLKAVHYTNLQPLWGLENILKKDKIT